MDLFAALWTPDLIITLVSTVLGFIAGLLKKRKTPAAPKTPSNPKAPPS
jgi:hypothetical protein